MDGNWSASINEPQFRAWVLERADTLDLTLFDNSMPKRIFFGLIEICQPVKGDIINPSTLETFNRLKPWFIRHELNNLAYGGCTQGKKAKYDHYYFRLSEEIKVMLNQQTLLWAGYDEESLFKGFEDPVFYKNEKIIGYVISHEYEGVIPAFDTLHD